MKIFNYVIEAKLSSLHSWTHFKIHKYDMHKMLVWGKLMVTYGQPHLEEVALCKECGSIEIDEKFSGDEGWTVCDACGTVEGGYEYITVEEAEKRGIL